MVVSLTVNQGYPGSSPGDGVKISSTFHLSIMAMQSAVNRCDESRYLGSIPRGGVSLYKVNK